MKKIILILIVAMSLFSFKKGEKCLVSGTWKIDKIVTPRDELNGGQVEVTFKDNGYIDFGTDKNVCRYSADNNVLTINNHSYNYSCSKNKLIIDTYLLLSISETAPQLTDYKTYLSK